MLLAKCVLVLLGIVLVQGHAPCTCGGCGLCGIGGGLSWTDLEPSACGLGSGESMCHCGHGGHGGYGGMSGEDGHGCVPLVVRPQPIPKPAVPVPASTAPEPGPCACKKAIVKPAVLPKPVCHAGGAYSTSFTNTCGCNHNCHSSTILDGSATVLGGSCYNPVEYPPILFDGNYYNQANLAPADAVSIALAQQKAQQQCAVTHSEDKLAFGFRKLPLEIPKVIMRKETIPEELIYDLNGQIVELKPINLCGVENLDEQAAEDLIALEEEEYTYDTVNHGIRQLSLGELGYGPAKLPSNTFIDIPVSAVEGAVEAAASSALGSLGSAIGSAIGAAGSALGLDGSALNGCNSGFVAGNVVYKTVPKPNPICIPPPPDVIDCESSEEVQTLSSELDGGSTHIITGSCCLPCLQNVFKHHSHSSSSSASTTCSKKSKVLIEKCSQLL